jgi:hypothetical protein
MLGSPAIDAGNNDYATDWDQRGEGYPRIVNGIIDIGAFEYQGDGSAPAVPRKGQTEGQILAVLVSGLPLRPALSTLWSAAPFPGPAAIPSLNCDVVPKQEVSSMPKAVDQVFASLEEDARGPRPTQWRDLEPIQSIWSNPDFLTEAAGLIR